MTPAEYAEKWPDAERRVSDHADRLMLSAVVAIFANRVRPRLVGSGFFVSYDSRLYLVSARHVFSEQNGEDENHLFFYTGRRTIAPVAGRLFRTNATGRDVVDIGAMWLADPAPKWSGEAARTPISLDEFADRSAADRESFLLGGFPASRHKIDAPTQTIVGRPHGLLRASAEREAYDFHGLSTDTHVLLDFDQRKEVTFVGRSNARFPDPKGISGAPLWLVAFHEDGSIGTRVAGIAIEHRMRSKHKVIVCTRIEAVAEMIRLADVIKDAGRKG